ncbi:jg3664 [Pararge aegeria aegeria]|uniref:Jg3664 protein n=1 Tax=Pararge aegeria aegeria TaxID=348720 RepID=A0A8S4SDQ0_9NEOP|nr:jg3664 [Pararge aegeria aegeria]
MKGRVQKAVVHKKISVNIEEDKGLESPNEVPCNIHPLIVRRVKAVVHHAGSVLIGLLRTFWIALRHAGSLTMFSFTVATSHIRKLGVKSSPRNINDFQGILNQLYERFEVNNDRMRQRDRRPTGGSISYYRNGWRRRMGDQQNKLTIEIFGFVNMHACQKLTNKAVPVMYRMKNRHEFLCYSSERLYITEDDAGAPAMRRGHLVAVTVGGVDFDGEHLAVGMKMKCFCSWIAENLP